MTEADMNRFFGNFVRKNPPKEAEVYELKIVKGKSLPFDRVQEHQIENLLSAERGDFYYKIPDQPVFYGSRRRFIVQKPFDCLFIKKAKGYIVIWFYKPREPKRFYKIRVRNFSVMRDLAKRKSFTEDMVKRYCSEFLEIK